MFTPRATWKQQNCKINVRRIIFPKQTHIHRDRSLLPNRLLRRLDGGAGSGLAHRVQRGRVLEALHFPSTPDSSAFSNPVTLKCWGWWKESPSPFLSCHHQWMLPQRAPSCLQPHCLWTCRLLCQECLFSTLPSRSNLRDSSSRAALSVSAREDRSTGP